ncbi:MAG: hypothetical protein IJ757_07985 [Clostridiales bacterium]|nr:hypothetical protein [Clostridiales bacterium]
MAENKPNEVYVEGTQFYRRSGAADILRIVLITAVTLICLSILSIWAIADAGARQAYKEARDIRRALRVVGTEYYGGMQSIYDPGALNGLADGAADKVAEISTRTGDVILYSWDEANNAPLQFEYRKGLYRVIYTDYGSSNNVSSGVEGDFSVYYSFEILRYEAE